MFVVLNLLQPKSFNSEDAFPPTIYHATLCALQHG